jgi:flavin-dependent dehydrogenase
VERCDVLVVGGGPGGSTCARALRAAGVDVLVLDRKAFPRDKVCAGWITPQILEELTIEPGDYRKDRVMQPIRGFRVRRVGDREALADRGGVVSYGVRRCEFDHFLLQRSGARLRLGEPLKSLRRASGRWIANEAIEAAVLVGAGGHFCPVARELGAHPGRGETAVVAREIEFPMAPEQELACPASGEFPELFFTADLRGYGWVVRKGAWLNVGIGRQDAEAFPRHVDEFLDFLEAERRVPPGLPRHLKGHAYLLYEDARRPLAREGALLVGDSAGLAYGRSGEGIRPAVESGMLAATEIAEALSRCGGLDDRAARAYADALRRRFGPREAAKRRGPTDFLPARWRGPVSGRVLAWPWFASKVVVDRWFLHRQVPPLAALGA